ncbi:hypothetical protein C485_08132 [Natrinema altunense JCM 12890]|uniref:Uncharacterized protein n=1 Tax=Natrinema altunense (strain JCM 12890 / CGMCC 1.3731 / AJ2) TaxID=1227494 RepID=L9ZKI0_NATA2|nr:hypothetical protein C485_08132 [Natrinema altunense JCM 12890]
MILHKPCINEPEIGIVSFEYFELLFEFRRSPSIVGIEERHVLAVGGIDTRVSGLRCTPVFGVPKQSYSVAMSVDNWFKIRVRGVVDDDYLDVINCLLIHTL